MDQIKTSMFLSFAAAGCSFSLHSCLLLALFDIVDACAKETLKVIIADLNGDYFGILVDESKDISHKEQMALVLRYVDKKGEVVERFIGLVHVSNTSACSLKKEIYSLLADHSLGPSKIRGQGYDGATIAKKHVEVEDFFYHVTNVLNVIGGSFKRRDLLRHHQAEKLKLQDMRENGWGSLLNDISSFCDSHDILIPKLDEPYFPGKSKLSSDLLLGMGSLNPVNSFYNFDKDRIMALAKCYPNEFDDGKLRDLSYQLDTFIIYMRGGNAKFSNLQGIHDLAKALVETKKMNNPIELLGTREGMPLPAMDGLVASIRLAGLTYF
ncbi:uncharacterized protein LOC124887906 [Capsicum annuum]|uniref:uncharacterized protein LOC124887906 n=1 Tax=Capsicum annuum TaxID=4072 RepID=UPI001FB05BDF|nr:uncharacterized protein LOC124887906 [Capsicum annuum]